MKVYFIVNSKTNEHFEDSYYKNINDAWYRRDVIYELDDDWVVREGLIR